MVRPVRFFLQSEISTECDACGKHFPLSMGGVCIECRRALCSKHLFGSWFRRLATDLGARIVCVECRGKAAAG